MRVNYLKLKLQESVNDLVLDVDLVEYENNYSKFYEIASHYIDLSIYILSKKFSYSQIKLIKAKNNLKLISKNFTLNLKFGIILQPTIQ